MKSDQKKFSNQKTTFIPIIQDSEVIQLNINGRTLDLKRKINIKEFSETLLPLLQDLENYIELNNFSKSTSQNFNSLKRKWNSESLENYWKELLDIQKEILKILIERKKISRNTLRELLIERKFLKSENNVTKRFAAIVAGMSRKWNSQNFEPLLVIIRNYYILNKDIKNILEEIMSRDNQ